MAGRGRDRQTMISRFFDEEEKHLKKFFAPGI